MNPIPLPYDDWFLTLTPRFAAFGSPWQALLLAALALVPLALLLWLYLYEMRLLRPLTALLLLGLRCTAIALLWFVVSFQPTLAKTEHETIDSRVIILVDHSQSMDVPDPQRSPQERIQIAKALRMSPDEVDHLTRRDITNRLLTSEGLNAIAALGRRHEVEIYGFHKNLWKIPAQDVNQDTFRVDAPDDNAGSLLDAHFTDVVQPLKAALERTGKKGGVTSAVLLFTDGRHNWNKDAADNQLAPNKFFTEAAEQFKMQKVPLYPVAVGSKNPPPDLILASVKAPVDVLKGTDASISVHVKANAIAAQNLFVELHEDGKLIDKEHRKTIKHDGTDRGYTVHFQLPLKEEGTRKLAVKVRPEQADTKEISLDNNIKDMVIRVAKDPPRVLVVDGEARWEFHYLINALRRDKMIEPEAVVFDQPRIEQIAEAELEKTGHPKSRLPQKEDDDEFDPLQKYGCIIIGDVSPEQLPLEDRQRLERYVSAHGGTLVLVAGKRWMPAAFADLNRSVGVSPAQKSAGETPTPREGAGETPTPRGETEELDPLAKLLPLSELREFRPEAGFKVTLTDEGSGKPYLQMEPTPEDSAQRWAKLPLHYWALIGKAKPGATALAYIKDDQPNAKDPQREQALIVLQNYGFGRVLYAGMDSTWRWRYRTGDLYHHRFWGQLIRWAVSDKILPAGNQYVRYGTKKPAYAPDEEIEMQVRLVEGISRLTGEAKVQILHIDAQGNEKSVRNIPLQRDTTNNLLTGQVRDLPPGKYRLQPDIPELQDKLHADTDSEAAGAHRDTFEVLPVESSEMENLSMNWPLLQALANQSGGEIVTPDRFGEFLDQIGRQTVTQSQHMERKFWEDQTLVWYLLAGFLVLLTIEWVTRKLVGLP